MAATLHSLTVLLLFLEGILQLNATANPLLLPWDEDSNLMVEVGKILCRARIKVLFVYFENQTTHDHSGEILREVTKCDTSYISIRKKSVPLEAVKDDGILMYMVMIIKDISQPLKLSLINKKSAAKHLSHVLLLVRNAENLSLGWMRASFRQFWSIWLLNIVIIFYRDDRLHIYRYNPFTDDFLLPVDLSQNQSPTLQQLFPKNLPNMHRKPLRMCLYMDDVRAIYGRKGKLMGSDGLLASYIAKRLNATRIITRPLFYNQSTDLCSKEIANEFDDVAMNIRFLAPKTFKNRIEPTIAHNRDDLCVIVPKAKAELLFWNIFRSFGGWVWLAIGISVLLSYLFCQLLFFSTSSLPRHGRYKRRFGQGGALDLFSSTLAQPLAHVPRNSCVSMFLIFWLYFGMLISTAFRGNLTSIMVYRKSMPDINDLSELAASSYKILIRSRHMKHIRQFLSNGREHEARIRELMQEVPDTELVKHFNHNDQSYAYLEKYHIASFQVNARQHMHLGRPLFHLMDSCLVPFHGVYTVPYGSPYLGFINQLIRGAHEFGFERYWDRIMSTAFIKSGTKVQNNRRHNSSDDPVVLKLEHFHAVFFLWAVGLALAVLIHLWELLQHNWAKAKRNR
ncbi:uncharacterized protein LOC6572259 isoform X1 [Drosophila mojavensis]|uniref:Uncharacterized protein, isoform A n=2 Tax=Drosophila mojavensis TaxID=7230 RepID=B4KDM8_DROMO|nr:uncharacterized protein LOC6572259 isoform X1 [Drosophila mojavensis]EDW13862.1 uncharacterized protein Dmoj_GI23650, isoform A [Drosophila mojavensis]